MNRILQLLLRTAGVFCLLCAGLPFAFYGISNTGVAAMLLLGAMLLALPLLWRTVLARRRVLRRVIAVLGSAALLLCLTISALMLWRGWFNRPPLEGRAAVIVLGAKVNGSSPSLMLRRRLDIAADYLRQNPEAYCIVSGGQGPDEDYPEALVMRDYLVRVGIDGARIQMEDTSTNTRQNLRNSRALLQAGDPVVLVTDGFHQLRASIFAGAEGLTAYNLPSLTPWGLLPAYWLREILGVAWAWVSIRFGPA